MKNLIFEILFVYMCFRNQLTDLFRGGKFDFFLNHLNLFCMEIIILPVTSKRLELQCQECCKGIGSATSSSGKACPYL